MRTLGNLMQTTSLIPRLRPGQVDMSSAVEGIKKASPANRRNRRIRECEFDSEKFARTYLSHHFSSEFCEFHYYIFKRIDAPPPPGGKRDALIGPRKFGKTSIINLVLPLQALAYQRKRFVLLIGEAAGAAEGNLATITQELENNELLLADFPHLAAAKDPKGQLVKWTDRQLVLANHATLMAKGMGTRMRGVKYRAARPDLAIIDDPESPETADTFLKRQRHKRWFGGTFMGLGAKNWDVFVIGNCPHHESLISGLVNHRKWIGIMYRAINIPPRKEDRYPIGNVKTDGSALWPEEWPLDALDNYKQQPEVGSLGFAREMMNDPREEENKPFDPLKFEYIEFTDDYLKSAKYVVKAIAIDPAGGEKPNEYKKGIRDWCVIVGGGRRKDGFIDIFEIEMTRATPEGQIDKALDMYKRTRIRKIGIEEIMFKNLYAPTFKAEARKRGLYPMVQTITSRKQNKQTRILGITGLVHNEENKPVVRFAAHLKDRHPQFFAQFDEFPMSFDDAPDATETLIRMLESTPTKSVPVGVGGSSYWRKS